MGTKEGGGVCVYVCFFLSLSLCIVLLGEGRSIKAKVCDMCHDDSYTSCHLFEEGRKF